MLCIVNWCGILMKGWCLKMKPRKRIIVLRSILLFFLESYYTIDQGIERVILSHSNILARIVYRAALANQNIAGLSKLSAEKFYAQAFLFLPAL